MGRKPEPLRWAFADWGCLPNIRKAKKSRLCLEAVELRKQMYEKLGRVDDLKQLYKLYHMAASFCTGEEAEKYNALAKELESNPEVWEYVQTCSEVLEVLRHMDKFYINKLPRSLVMNLYFGYSFDYDFRMTKSLAEENLCTGALAMLNHLYEKYWKDAEDLPKWGNISQLLAFLKL